MEVDGQIKAVISPNLPKLTGLKAFLQKYKIFCVITALWIVINLIFLSIGDDRKGFWPHIYSYTETIWDRNTTEYNPFSRWYYTHQVGRPGPERTEIKWDLKYYGLTEFLIYAVLIPLIVFFIYNAILRYNQNKPKQPLYKQNPNTGLIE